MDKNKEPGIPEVDTKTVSFSISLLKSLLNVFKSFCCLKVK